MVAFNVAVHLFHAKKFSFKIGAVQDFLSQSNKSNVLHGCGMASTDTCQSVVSHFEEKIQFL